MYTNIPNESTKLFDKNWSSNISDDQIKKSDVGFTFPDQHIIFHIWFDLPPNVFNITIYI